MSAQPLLRASAAPASARHAPARLHLARQLAQPRYRRRTPRPATVVRSRLVRALIDDARPVAVLVAPAGYGKGTLLEQWSAQAPRPFACVELTAAHDEPRRLSAMIARAVDDVA